MLISEHNYSNKRKKKNSYNSTSLKATNDDDNDKVIEHLNRHGNNKYDIIFVLRLSLKLKCQYI